MSKENVAVGGAVLTALSASLCCIGPLLTLLFGFGAFGAATVFASARPYLLIVAVVALAFSFYRLYWRRGECTPDGACPTGPSRTARLSVWMATVAVLLFALSPYYVGTVARHLSANEDKGIVSDGKATRRETFKVSGMTCAGCETTIRVALEKTPGVRSAQVSYDQGEAVVDYDPNLTDKEQITAAINETGYTCELPK